ncbi:hypothetical protein A2331_00470 [Candidatus Falkowbacteria bacterium RIFOXYB2_FULL_34_18]|uniref:Glycerate kinase n=1 Tax=Candidatus Falkowbacteria bacterium RIFOXYD2_FULL_34_120 TaxID=1798007 RepID=A0A1F5TMN5_9BACT|nr:MAG: hypothetical protein A2331_00470 [Candidatus Falkowbacteria bacterium RIFOXYB2_FULL_34_18]OGF28521.1 MAG: hypothetical protein A2500_06695 [Candidatus Falkowbacteria bacterium RIFOXYC12_FULL_34_55]OGF38142.1 MAG: hypothetical protein A2466_00100 [Candidatus Falkowbacteria bacterium RIFOXYC2_FULL_34_220]OGF38539.1 MAG: hypothetical protein A2515_05130 [Candidatus Falkowbacteria bacterium RIFOXYD12_FULL_34_57]OGF40210.1 MAG: hypothetical protein A2531_04625 [Candidatus Falkowbacteria bact
MIKNYQELACTEDRKKILDIFIAGIKAADPAKIMKSEVRYNKKVNSLTVHNQHFNLFSGRIFVVGGGKAGGKMAEALEDILGEKEIEAGIINDIEVSKEYGRMQLVIDYIQRFWNFLKCFVLGVNCDWRYKTRKIKIIRAGHPIPDNKGVRGVNMMMELKERYKINKKDTVICLISGGASALMPLPVEKISLSDKQKTTEILLDSGADIKEVNTVRKHLSRVKGGQLAQHFYPARIISLIISDVSDNDISVIASGPTAMDTTTFKDVEIIIEKYGLHDKLPKNVKEYLVRGAKSKEPDTPKVLKNINNFIIGDNGIILGKMAEIAKSLGLNPIIASFNQEGDTSWAAKERADEVLNNKYSGYDIVIVGGETTIKLPENHGLGGRNQHYAAITMATMPENRKWAMLAASTDGSDFIPGVAGALIDNESMSETRKKDLDIDLYLHNYNTNRFFEKLKKSLINMENTGTNVGDIVIYLLK